MAPQGVRGLSVHPTMALPAGFLGLGLLCPCHEDLEKDLESSPGPQKYVKQLLFGLFSEVMVIIVRTFGVQARFSQGLVSGTTSPLQDPPDVRVPVW